MLSVKGACDLVWIRTLACGAGDPGFKSQRARHLLGSNPLEDLDPLSTSQPDYFTSFFRITQQILLGS
jgi:hypothetical protein